VKLTAPRDGLTVTAGTTLTLTAAAAPRTGSLSRLDFYRADTSYDGDGNLVAGSPTLIGSVVSDFAAPSGSIVWRTTASAGYGPTALTAVATDSGGHQATSAPVYVTADGYAPPGAHVSPFVAIARARRFCQDLGTPVPDGTPTRAVYQNPAPSYYLPVWKVGFLGASSVEVADANGVVTAYFNTALTVQLPASAQPITQAQAQAAASALLRATGQPAVELANQTLTRSNLTDPFTFAGDLWTVRWSRVASGAGGAPYRRDGASLLLQAETGAVEAWRLSFPTPALAGPAAQSVPQAQAQQTAQAKMAAQGRLLGLSASQALKGSSLAVVQPDTLWPPDGLSPADLIIWSAAGGGTAAPTPGSAPRLVWDCFFSDLPAGAASPSGSTGAEVWVDAATGHVIGGDLLRVKARPRRRPALRPLVPFSAPRH
jgi:hypothetical protein